MSKNDLFGIDISSWQKGFDLAGAGVDFAICKISEGQKWIDPCFNDFYAAAKCPLGAYVYSHATTEEAAIAEAKKALELLGGRFIRLGVFMDVEEEKQLGLPNLGAIVDAFCNTIRESGYIAGAYGSAGRLWARISPSTFNGLVWAASWFAAPRFACDIWQYSSTTKFDGYNGNVDADRVMSERLKAILDDKPADDLQAPASFSLSLPVLKQGDRGEAVKALQGELIARGYFCGGKRDWRGGERADGIYGNVTAESVRTFQRARGLNDNGIVGQETRAALLGLE